MPVTREQRRDLTAGDLVDGEVSATTKGTIVLPTSVRIERYPKPYLYWTLGTSPSRMAARRWCAADCRRLWPETGQKRTRTSNSKT